MTRLLTAQELAARLGCSPKWVRKHALMGDLPHMRLPGLLRFSPADVDAWLETAKVRPAEPRATYRRDELAAVRQRLQATPDRRRKRPPARRSSA